MKKTILLIILSLTLFSNKVMSQNTDTYLYLKHKYGGHIQDTTKTSSGYEVDYTYLHLVYNTKLNNIQLRSYYRGKHYITVIVDNEKIFI